MNMAVALAASALGAVACLAGFAWYTAHRVEARVPPLGDFIDVTGARLHYLDRGTGPVVLLLHGWGGNLRHYHRLIERLASHCRVIALDIPGCGYSRMLDGRHASLRRRAEIVAAFMRCLALEQVLVVGHSLGGALALALALDHPQRLRGLVLLAGLSQPAKLKGVPIRSPAMQRLFAWTLLAPLGLLLHRASLRAAFAPDAVTPDFDTAGGALLGYRPDNFVNACRDVATVSAELAGMVPRYPSLALPVEVVFGRQDGLLEPCVHGEGLAAAIPQATLRMIEGGHMLPLTAADRIADWILDASAPIGRRPARRIRPEPDTLGISP